MPGSELGRSVTLEEERAWLRRLAALVATGVAASEVFAAIFRREPDGSVTIVGSWGDPSLAAQIEAPIVVDGERWGHIGVATTEGTPLPDGVEERLAELTELVATAIDGSTMRERLARIADEQAALRRVATLVANGAPPKDVFHAVAEELGKLLDVTSSGLARYEEPDMVRQIAGWGQITKVVPDGASFPLGGNNAVTEIARTGKPARIENYGSTASGPIGERSQQVNVETSIGVPVVVGGRLWGCMIASAAHGRPLPADAVPRLAQFIELITTAVANAEARVELARLADEQAALRRVATLVAQELPARELFAKVGEEVAGVLGPHVEHAILRFEPDDTATVLAGSSAVVPGGIVVGQRLALDGSSVSAQVYRRRRAVRVDDYTTARGDVADHASVHEITSAVGCPILVTGRVWGVMVVAHREPEPFPADTERRVSQFTELVATALANAEARAQLQRLADEQAALRRVATLVAEAPAPAELFNAVVAEVARLFPGAGVGMVRSESADDAMVVAAHGLDPAVVRVGMRLPLEGDSVTARVLRTGRSTRMNLRREGHGAIAEIARRANSLTAIGAPITVEGRVWGMIIASWEEPPPGDAEERLAQIAELLDTAIANADSRDQLTASRVRVLTAGDDARRQVVRDLHDGAQQRIVHTIVTLKLAQRALNDADSERTRELVGEALAHTEQSNNELRELAHGILPPVLTHGGLRAGVDAVVSRMDVPIDEDVTATRLPPEIEASAYFVIAEALTNLAKHARASKGSVRAAVADGTLRIEVRDDGIGGADPSGHGLLGVGDRVAALGGRLRIDSPRGAGTVLTAELPI